MSTDLAARQEPGISTEALEFEYLLGDQLVTVGLSHDELLRQGPIEVTVDGHMVKLPRVKVGYDAVNKVTSTRLTTIYDAANQVYLDQLQEPNPIPLLCHREHMTPAAVCRVCLVEVQKAHKLAAACHHPIMPGMVVSTIRTSPRVAAIVKTLTELLITDHLLPREAGQDYGENELEALAHRLGLSASRYPRSTRDRGRDDSSLLISVNHNACILCDRCVRACNEIRHNNVIGRMAKGSSTRIAFDLNDPMGASSCVACGECMVSCPTGALSNKTVVEQQWSEPPAAERVTPQDLAAHPLFAGISQPFLQWNRGAAVRRHYRPGEIICREGQYGATAFIIEAGKVEVRLRSPLGHVAKQAGGWRSFLGRFSTGLLARGRDAREGESTASQINVDAPITLAYSNPVATLGPEDIIFGEMTCLNHYPRATTVTAVEDCTLLEIRRNVLYMLQRNKASKSLLDALYRDRSLETHLRSVKLFTSLLENDDQFQSFVDYLRPRVRLVRLHPGQVIFRQGDRADHFYLVRLGFVKVSQDRIGGEHVLNYVGPGGYFGEVGLLSDLPELEGMAPAKVRTATCRALDHVDLVRISGEDFAALLAQFPQMRQRLVEDARRALKSNEEERLRVEHVPLTEFLQQGLFNAQSLLVLDLEKCTRCDECTKACSDAHDGVTRLIREGLRFDKFLVASSCRSCLDPYCLVGCPVDSIHRKDSREIVIEDWCIGCGKCAENCPYGNINMHGQATAEFLVDPNNPARKAQVIQQKATTCDLCRNVVDKQPSCVYACPHDAAHRMSGPELLDLVKLEDTFLRAGD